MAVVDARIPFRLIDSIHSTALMTKAIQESGKYSLTSPYIENLRIGLEPESNIAESIDAALK